MVRVLLAGRRRQPDQLILLRIQFLTFSKPCTFPCRIVFILKERPVTGVVFRIDIQLSGGNAPRHERLASSRVLRPF